MSPSLQWFRLWFGVGAPLFFLSALTLAFTINTWWGIATLTLYLIGITDTLFTTCRRCPNYGTYNCGLPGRFAAQVVKRRFDMPSQKRLQLHFYGDCAVTLYALMILWQVPALFILGCAWALGAWKISLGPKKYHGLMHRLWDEPLAKSKYIKYTI